MTAPAGPGTGRAGGCCTRSGRCSSPRSPIPRCGAGGPPAGVRPGSRCGPTWTRAGPARPRPARGWRDPRDAWTAYALDARLMCVRDPVLRRLGRAARADLPRVGAPRRRRTLRAPTREDLDYHLSTLFPPVRPHGHLELRMIDAQPGDGWVVPAAVASALAGDERAADAALAAAEPLWDGTGQCCGGEDPWLRAARSGPADPCLSRAAKQCFEAAGAALGRLRRAGPDPAGGGRLYRAVCPARPMSGRRPTGGSHMTEPAAGTA